MRFIEESGSLAVEDQLWSYPHELCDVGGGIDFDDALGALERRFGLPIGLRTFDHDCTGPREGMSQLMIGDAFPIVRHIKSLRSVSLSSGYPSV